MANFSVPFPNFQPNTTIASAQVNANFAALVNALNAGGGSVLTPNGGYVILPGGLTIQWGFATITADGSGAVNVVFPLQFPTALLGKPICGISNNYPLNPWAVGAPQTNAETQSGFSVYAQGAPAGKTVTVAWIALGY